MKSNGEVSVRFGKVATTITAELATASATNAVNSKVENSQASGAIPAGDYNCCRPVRPPGGKCALKFQETREVRQDKMQALSRI